MSAWLYAPFVAQGVLMGIDEGWFHVRRGLPLWERVGHPIDTAFFLTALAFAAMAPERPWTLPVFLVLAVLSCLVITKDEWVHARLCPGTEHAVHALLFMLHPVALFAAWKLRATELPAWPLLAGVALLGCWQVVYWNFVRGSA